MPANLPPQYFEVERRYREARSPQEKIRLLEELPAIIPKHKDFAHHLTYARVWGRGTYGGQRVHRDHVVQDGDIIELHV